MYNFSPVIFAFLLPHLKGWLSRVMTCCFICLTFTGFSQTYSPNQKKDSLSNVPPELLKLYENIIKGKNIHQTESDELEIDGLIFDETLSKAGRKFYEDYYNSWVPPENASNYSIYIRETPYMMNMTLISVKVNDYEILNTRVQPQDDFISALVNDAVIMTRDALLKIEDLKRQIEQGDQIGTGIY